MKLDRSYDNYRSYKGTEIPDFKDDESARYKWQGIALMIAAVVGGIAGTVVPLKVLDYHGFGLVGGVAGGLLGFMIGAVRHEKGTKLQISERDIFKINAKEFDDWLQKNQKFQPGTASWFEWDSWTNWIKGEDL
ncbi:MAG: hypothetical protein H7A36_05390 [Chlamydiales bacterium]|nr:hypothetical protein [Chlamydiales bacterium]